MKAKRKVWNLVATALLLALLVALQGLTANWGQAVTGSCVNCVLAMAALTVGWSGGLAVALVSPVLAYLLGIAPQILTVPAIMLGNTAYVLLFSLIAGKGSKFWLRRWIAWLAAAFGKFGVLYGCVVGLICGVFSEKLMNAGVLKEPMIAALTIKFGWMQLLTALLGGAVAAAIFPLVRKAAKLDDQ